MGVEEVPNARDTRHQSASRYEQSPKHHIYFMKRRSSPQPMHRSMQVDFLPLYLESILTKDYIIGRTWSIHTLTI
jgi:hypothetical protein